MVINRDRQWLFLKEGLVILNKSFDFFLDSQHLRVSGFELGVDKNELLLLVEALERLLTETSFGVKHSELLKVIDLFQALDCLGINVNSVEKFKSSLEILLLHVDVGQLHSCLVLAFINLKSLIKMRNLLLWVGRLLAQDHASFRDVSQNQVVIFYLLSNVDIRVEKLCARILTWDVCFKSINLRFLNHSKSPNVYENTLEFRRGIHVEMTRELLEDFIFVHHPLKVLVELVVT